MVIGLFGPLVWVYAAIVLAAVSAGILIWRAFAKP